MSDNVKITDEMVQMARAAGPVRLEGGYETVRAMLSAALNPPSEPEIPVTAQMLHAGDMAWQSLWGGGENVRGEILLSTYLAMRKLEPQVERRMPRQDSLFGKNVFVLNNGEFLHRRDRSGVVESLRTHRRKDDPQ